MALKGYKPKHKKALWTNAFPGQMQSRIMAVMAEHYLGPRPPAKPPGPIISRLARIKPKSKRRQKTDRGYGPAARAFVASASARGESCPVVAAIPELRDGRKYGHPISARLAECHHVWGRGWNGELVMRFECCMPVSRQGHRWIEANKDEARRRGWLAPKGQWNNPAPGMTCARLQQMAEEGKL